MLFVLYMELSDPFQHRLLGLIKLKNSLQLQLNSWNKNPRIGGNNNDNVVIILTSRLATANRSHISIRVTKFVGQGRWHQ